MIINECGAFIEKRISQEKQKFLENTLPSVIFFTTNPT
jgi:hypothetical protein